MFYLRIIIYSIVVICMIIYFVHIKNKPKKTKKLDYKQKQKKQKKMIDNIKKSKVIQLKENTKTNLKVTYTLGDGKVKVINIKEIKGFSDNKESGVKSLLAEKWHISKNNIVIHSIERT